MEFQFNNLIKSIMESFSFANLPDSAPYGFWIDSHAIPHVVPHGNHERVALRIINANPQLKREYSIAAQKSFSAAYFVTKEKGWIRVVTEGDILHYGINKQPNRHQLEMVADIAKFYNLSLRRA